MITFTDKRGNKINKYENGFFEFDPNYTQNFNYTLVNIINILYGIDRISEMLQNPEFNIIVLGDIHRTQFIAGKKFPWLTIKGMLNNQMVLPSTHIYVCYRFLYTPNGYQQYGECFAPDQYIPNMRHDNELIIGRWEFNDITYTTDNNEIVFENKPKHIKEYKEKQKIIDPKTGLPIVF
jgi:hypothetical protein